MKYFIIPILIFTYAFGEPGAPGNTSYVDTGSFTDRDGGVATYETTIEYDADGNQVSHTETINNPDGSVTITTYDEDGNELEGDTTVTLESIQKNHTESLTAPIMNIFATTEWKLLLSEFEINLNIGLCGNAPAMIGFEAHMIDIVGYYEETNKPLYFPFADITIEANPIKSNSPYASSDNLGRPQAKNGHFIYVPILGMVFKKTLPFFCFHSGPMMIPYMSEFDPSYKMDTLSMQMIPHMIAMFSPDSLILGLLDCVSTEICNVLYGKGTDIESDDMLATGLENGDESTINQYRNGGRDLCNTVRDSLYFINGCNGFNPVGGYHTGRRPIVDAHLGWAGLSNMLYTFSAITSVPVLQKTANLALEYGTHPDVTFIPDTMCAPRDFAMAAPSWNVLQLSGYPVTQNALEEGSSITADIAANVPGAAGSVNIVWKRRDYYAFAYACAK